MLSATFLHATVGVDGVPLLGVVVSFISRHVGGSLLYKN